MFDLDKPGSKLLLLLHICEFLVDGVKLDVGRRCIQRHLLARILQPRLRRAKPVSSGIDIALLGNAVDQRLHGRAPDRGWRTGITHFREDRQPGLDIDGGNHRILALRQLRARLVHISLRRAHPGAVALRQVYHCRQRNLRLHRDGQANQPGRKSGHNSR